MTEKKSDLRSLAEAMWPRQPKSPDEPQPRKVWFGSDPVRCDVCEEPISGEFVDGNVRGISSWAMMCIPCHESIGAGLGSGRGQKYRQEGPEWVKVAG